MPTIDDDASAATPVTVLLGISVISIVTYHGYALFHVAWERNWRSESVWGVRLWIPYLTLPLGFGLFVLQMVADLMASWMCQEEVLGQGEFEEDY